MKTHSLSALAFLLLVTSSASADFNSRETVNTATFVVAHDTPCGMGLVAIQGLDISANINTNGEYRKSNDYDLLSQSAKVQVFLVDIYTFDAQCNDVYDRVVLQGVDVNSVALDGTASDAVLCMEETGIDYSRSCPVQGVTLSHNRATIAGRYVTIGGRVLDLDLRIEATDALVTFDVKLNPAQLRLADSFHVPGETPVDGSVVDKSGGWGKLNENLRQAAYFADVAGTVVLDGQSISPNGPLNETVDYNFAIISSTKLIFSAPYPFPPVNPN